MQTSRYIEWILNKVSKNYCFQIPRPGGGGGGVDRVFILDFYVKEVSNMWNLGFEGLSHIDEPHILYLFSFSSHIASSCNITSV